MIEANTKWFQDHPDLLLPATGPNAEGLRPDAWAVPARAATATVTPYSVLVWNKDRFPNGFNGYRDLLDPSVKCLLAVRGDATQSAAGYVDFLEENLGEDYLRQLGAQDPKLYPSVVPATEAVGSGEVGVTNASLPSLAYQLKAAGAPIDYKIGQPGFAIGFGLAALTNAHRPNAATVFNDFALSLEGQTALNTDGFGAGARHARRTRYGGPHAVGLGEVHTRRHGCGQGQDGGLLQLAA